MARIASGVKPNASSSLSVSMPLSSVVASRAASQSAFWSRLHSSRRRLGGADAFHRPTGGPSAQGERPRRRSGGGGRGGAVPPQPFSGLRVVRATRRNPSTIVRMASAVETSRRFRRASPATSNTDAPVPTLWRQRHLPSVRRGSGLALLSVGPVGLRLRT
jgi:hypothetical protein